MEKNGIVSVRRREVASFYQTLPEGREQAVAVYASATRGYKLYLIERYKEEEAVFFKSASIRVDRLFYLELMNGSIDDAHRVKLMLSFLGRRRFGELNQPVAKFLATDRDLKSLFHQIYSGPEGKARVIRHERRDKNLNVYDVYLFTDDGLRYAYMKQVNRSTLKTVTREYVVELEAEVYDFCLETLDEETLITNIFYVMGRFVFAKSEGLRTEPAQTMEELVAGVLERDDFYYRDAMEGRYEGLTRSLETLDLAHMREAHREVMDQIDLALEANDPAEASPVAETALDALVSTIPEEAAWQRVREELAKLRETASNPEFFQVLLRSVNFKETFYNAVSGLDETLAVLGDSRVETEEKYLQMEDLAENLVYLNRRYKKSVGDYRNAVSAQAAEPAAPEKEPTLSAVRLFEEVEFDFELLDEINDLENDIEYDVFANEELTRPILESFDRFVKKFSGALDIVYEFRQLAYSLSTIDMMVNKIDLETMDDKRKRTLFSLIRSIVKDLKNWKRSVLVEKTAVNIHYMDKSLENDVKQVDLLIHGSPEEEEEESLELF